MASRSMKSLSVQDGINYSYILEKAKEAKPTFLLLHGFPSAAHDWRKQIKDLTTAGYGVLAPDLLGYGETAHPTEVEAYAMSKMSAHIAKILEHESLEHVIGVGHDWGSVLLSRLWTNHPKYFNALIFMAAPYTLPRPMDLELLNTQTEQAFGYPGFGYWFFFNEDGAAADIEQNHDSFTSLIYPNDPEIWKSELCVKGKAKEWLQNGKMNTLPVWLSKEEFNEHQEILIKGGYTGPTNWYKSAIRGVDRANDEKIPKEALIITKPVLFVVGEIDPLGRLDISLQMAEQGRQEGYLPKVDVKVVPGAGHWMGLEKPKEVFDIFDQFAKSLAEDDK